MAVKYFCDFCGVEFRKAEEVVYHVRKGNAGLASRRDNGGFQMYEDEWMCKSCYDRCGLEVVA